MYRDKEVNFEYIRGIEAVFGYFESGREMRDKAQEEVNQYKDVV